MPVGSRMSGPPVGLRIGLPVGPPPVGVNASPRMMQKPYIIGAGDGVKSAPKQGGKRKRSRGIAELGPVQVINGYEKVMLEDGGFKKRRVGAKQWQRCCSHGRRRNECKDCGGTSICEHSRQRHLCKDCGGASICEHNRQRHRCKDCQAPVGPPCPHGRPANKCKECKRLYGRQRPRFKQRVVVASESAAMGMVETAAAILLKHTAGSVPAAANNATVAATPARPDFADVDSKPEEPAGDGEPTHTQIRQI